MQIKVEVLDNGKIPTKGHSDDAGFDLYTKGYVLIGPGSVLKVPLGVKFEFPQGYYGEVVSKSGLGVRGLLVFAGVIDEGYRGEVHAVIANVGSDLLQIQVGEKIAQMLIRKNPMTTDCHLVEAKVHNTTARGLKGFGSTGDV